MWFRLIKSDWDSVLTIHTVMDKSQIIKNIFRLFLHLLQIHNNHKPTLH
jgi:hypothetical protein